MFIPSVCCFKKATSTFPPFPHKLGRPGSCSFPWIWPWWSPCRFVPSVRCLVSKLVGNVCVGGCTSQAEGFRVNSGALEVFHRQMEHLSPLFPLRLGGMWETQGFKLSLSPARCAPWCFHILMFNSWSNVEQLGQFRDGQQNREAASTLTWLAGRQSSGPSPAPNGAGLQPCFWPSLTLDSCVCPGCLREKTRPLSLCACKSPVLKPVHTSHWQNLEGINNVTSFENIAGHWLMLCFPHCLVFVVQIVSCWMLGGVTQGRFAPRLEQSSPCPASVQMVC